MPKGVARFMLPLLEMTSKPCACCSSAMSQWPRLGKKMPGVLFTLQPKPTHFRHVSTDTRVSTSSVFAVTPSHNLICALQAATFLLMQLGFNVNQVANNLATPLHVACWNKCSSVVQALVMAKVHIVFVHTICCAQPSRPAF